VARAEVQLVALERKREEQEVHGEFENERIRRMETTRGSPPSTESFVTWHAVIS
jgi:hypothetical protein